MVQQLRRGALLFKHAGQQARNTPIILLAGIVILLSLITNQRPTRNRAADALHVKDCQGRRRVAPRRSLSNASKKTHSCG